MKKIEVNIQRLEKFSHIPWNEVPNFFAPDWKDYEESELIQSEEEWEKGFEIFDKVTNKERINSLEKEALVNLDQFLQLHEIKGTPPFDEVVAALEEGAKDSPEEAEEVEETEEMDPTKKALSTMVELALDEPFNWKNLKLMDNEFNDYVLEKILEDYNLPPDASINEVLKLI
jgi:hypothetical protein